MLEWRCVQIKPTHVLETTAETEYGIFKSWITKANKKYTVELWLYIPDEIIEHSVVVTSEEQAKRFVNTWWRLNRED